MDVVVDQIGVCREREVADQPAAVPEERDARPSLTLEREHAVRRRELGLPHVFHAQSQLQVPVSRQGAQVDIAFCLARRPFELYR